MRINYNASAVITNKSLNANDTLLSQSLQRLSSGLKVNRAQDNPAGLAIAHRMDAQVKGLDVAKRNSNDGISVISTAEGALSEMSSILQRMNQLAVQSATGTYTDEDRELINQEAQQLKSELTRIAKDTEFNGMPLLDGSFDMKAYTDKPDKAKVDFYSQDVPAGKGYKVDFAALFAKDPADPDAFTIPSVEAPAKPSESGYTATINDKGDKVTLTGPGDFKLVIGIDEDVIKNAQTLADKKTAIKGIGTMEMDITGIGAMKIQVGANEGQELAVQIPTVSLYRMGIDDLDLSTVYGKPKNPSDPNSELVGGAEAGITAIKGALDYINDVRSRLGAYENRLEHNVTSVDVSYENMTASYSRIMDVDMAEEMTQYTTAQVLVQAGTSMLSQANERPQTVLQLLQ
ncbi:MAG: flagellin FliC3 [Lachnospiraceae bacterium]|nr:flagellin FliC3 [Lachnospiraceae bacterium]